MHEIDKMLYRSRDEVSELKDRLESGEDLQVRDEKTGKVHEVVDAIGIGVIVRMESGTRVITWEGSDCLKSERYEVVTA